MRIRPPDSLSIFFAHGERNLLDLGICREMVDALEEAGQDRAVGAVLLDAEGPVFCAGVDQDEAADPENVDHGFLHVKLLQIGGKLTKPLVAAVQGAALAEGVALAAVSEIVPEMRPVLESIFSPVGRPDAE